MFRRRPDLIVPIRDRRQHKRYLTLKNFLIVTVVTLVVFAAINIRSEMRGLAPGSFGRLYERQITPKVEQKPVEIVQEAPPKVADATHADPMLVAPMAREQWLHETPDTTTTTVVPVIAPAQMTQGSGDVVIVGGPEGVSVVRRERRKPMLSGGFGR